MPGFGRLTLSRCRERPSTYLLLVEWDRLQDHTEGFAGSPQYRQWRRLLHGFYEPFPVVEHYEKVHNPDRLARTALAGVPKASADPAGTPAARARPGLGALRRPGLT